ncbi:hypothetical protein N431DRAFT_155871 [Stipitochalara longipes BDJ]|nr:hypothetical protein N431DRAFT_155871 [Stipitochalara longipes BDJ]
MGCEQVRGTFTAQQLRQLYPELLAFDFCLNTLLWLIDVQVDLAFAHALAQSSSRSLLARTVLRPCQACLVLFLWCCGAALPRCHRYLWPGPHWPVDPVTPYPPCWLLLRAALACAALY